MLEIRDATPEEARAFLGVTDETIMVMRGAFYEGRCVAAAGLMRDCRYYGSLFEESGRLLAFFQVKENPPGFGIAAILGMAGFLREHRKTVYVQLDDSEPLAERLLTALKFTPTDEVWIFDRNRKMRLWKWQPSQ